MRKIAFRASRHIDFDSGNVKVQPMDLFKELSPPRSVEDMLDLFECRVEVWQFGPAIEILKEIEAHRPFGSSVWAHTAYALMAVLFSYFEMIGKTLNPSSKSRGTASVDFNYGFCDVYPQFDVANGERSDEALPEVQEFRDRVRNGLYHLGYTKGRVEIHNEPQTSVPGDFFVDRDEERPRYLVNPHRMTRTIVDHFPKFMHRLRASAEQSEDLGRRFQRFFVEFHDPGCDLP